MLLPFILPAAETQKAISDNSFLIEEAYNQETRVVQHIFTFQRDFQSHDWFASFTQEWPAFGPLHQLSYTLGLAWAHEGQPKLAAGPYFLNYRYQLVYNDRVAVSPRLSLAIPGRAVAGMTTGIGWQANIPASITLGRRFVCHLNLGGTWFPAADNGARKLALLQFNYGASVIYLLSGTFNLMLEAAGTRGERLLAAVQSPAGKEWQSDFFLNPGARLAFNFRTGMQIVCGMALPLEVVDARWHAGAFLYFSIEHGY
jgi:hypothetical protein